MLQSEFNASVALEIARMVKAAEVAANDDHDYECPWCDRRGAEIEACCGSGEAA